MRLTSPVVVLVLLAMAGCGGGDDSFAEDYNEAVEPLAGLQSETGTSARQFDRLAEKTRQTHANLADLDPPEDAQEEMDTLLSGLAGVTEDRGGPAGGDGAAAGRGGLSRRDQPEGWAPSLRIAGNSTTSRIECRPLRIITSRSIPMPMPPVGGMPCSSACT